MVPLYHLVIRHSHGQWPIYKMVYLSNMVIFSSLYFKLSKDMFMFGFWFWMFQIPCSSLSWDTITPLICAVGCLTPTIGFEHQQKPLNSPFLGNNPFLGNTDHVCLGYTFGEFCRISWARAHSQVSILIKHGFLNNPACSRSIFLSQPPFIGDVLGTSQPRQLISLVNKLSLAVCSMFSVSTTCFSGQNFEVWIDAKHGQNRC